MINIKKMWLAFAAVVVITAAMLVSVTMASAQGKGKQQGGYNFRTVVELGDLAPGGGSHEGDLEPQDINASGTVIFASDLEDENGNFAGEGLFLSRKGLISQIVRSGMPAPGTSVNFGIFGILTPGGLNDAGDAAFGFTLDLPGNIP